MEGFISFERIWNNGAKPLNACLYPNSCMGLLKYLTSLKGKKAFHLETALLDKKRNSLTTDRVDVSDPDSYRVQLKKVSISLN